MTNWSKAHGFRLVCVLIIMLTNFLLIINYISQSQSIKQDLNNLEKDIKKEQIQEESLKNKTLSLIKQESQKRMQNSDYIKIDSQGLKKIGQLDEINNSKK